MGWFRLMEEYRKIGLYCPAIIPNRYGEFLYKHTVDGRDYYIYAEEFSAFKTASQLNVEKKQYMPDVLRTLGVIASKRLDFLDFPSAYCLLESFAGEEFTDEETECAVAFVDYIRQNIPAHLSRAEALLKLYYQRQEELRTVYSLLPTSCFQADLNDSNILLDENNYFVGLIDFNLCGKEPILNYAVREALWNVADNRLFGEKGSRLYFYDEELDELRIKLFLENIGYIQEHYEFSEFEKEVFPVLFRYMNSFWWFHLDEIKLIKEDECKITQLFDWLEYQMIRDDIRLP